MVSANMRKSRIAQIRSTVQKATAQGTPVLKEKLIGLLCCEWGTARRTILEYVNNLVSAEYMVEAKDEEGRTLLIFKSLKLDE